MRAIGKRIGRMDMEGTSIKTDRFTRETGQTINSMERDMSSGLMGPLTKDNMSTAQSTEEEPLNGKTARSMLANSVRM